jgi:mono/diheme cytochrome c family protein
MVFVVMLFANEPDDGGDVVAVDETDEPADGGTGTTAVAEVDGAAVFEGRCASCHGAEGGGQSGPRLSDGRVVERFPDIEDQIELVTDGKSGMPSFEDRLSEEEIRAVVEFTRSL